MRKNLNIQPLREKFIHSGNKKNGAIYPINQALKIIFYKLYLFYNSENYCSTILKQYLFTSKQYQ